jgi:hypothetical protein
MPEIKTACSKLLLGTSNYPQNQWTGNNPSEGSSYSKNEQKLAMNGDDIHTTTPHIDRFFGRLSY